MPALLLMQRAMRLLTSLEFGLNQRRQVVTGRTVVSVQRAVDRMVSGLRLLLIQMAHRRRRVATDSRSQTVRKLKYRTGLLGQERLAGSSELLYLELRPDQRLVSGLGRSLAQIHPQHLATTGCQIREHRMLASRMLNYHPVWVHQMVRPSPPNLTVRQILGQPGLD